MERRKIFRHSLLDLRRSTQVAIIVHVRRTLLFTRYRDKGGADQQNDGQAPFGRCQSHFS